MRALYPCSLCPFPASINGDLRGSIIFTVQSEMLTWNLPPTPTLSPWSQLPVPLWISVLLIHPTHIIMIIILSSLSFILYYLPGLIISCLSTPETLLRGRFMHFHFVQLHLWSELSSGEFIKLSVNFISLVTACAGLQEEPQTAWCLI